MRRTGALLIRKVEFWLVFLYNRVVVLLSRGAEMVSLYVKAPFTYQEAQQASSGSSACIWAPDAYIGTNPVRSLIRRLRREQGELGLQTIPDA